MQSVQQAHLYDGYYSNRNTEQLRLCVFKIHQNPFCIIEKTSHKSSKNLTKNVSDDK